MSNLTGTNQSSSELFHLQRHSVDFGLVWEDQAEDMEQLLVTQVPVLASNSSLNVKSSDGNQVQHVLIEGDNLHALHTLQATHRNSVDVIYIDPPYNTGDKDWKYNNKLVTSDDSYYHSQWLSFMNRRLALTKKLLTPNGILVVTIDEHEVNRLGLLLEKHFPENNIQMVTIVINGAGSARGYFSRVEEYAYFVFLGDAKPNPLEDDMLSTNRPEEQAVNWPSFIRTGPSSTRNDRPNMFFPIHVDKVTGKILDVGDPHPIEEQRLESSTMPGAVVVYPLSGSGDEGRWRTGAPAFRELAKSGFARASVSKRGVSVQYLQKKQLEDIESGRISIQNYHPETGVANLKYERPPLREVKTVWNRPSHNAGASGTQLLKKIIGNRDFPFPKSIHAVTDTLRLVTKPGDVVLDFFAGSGTTLHAVAQLNAEDGGNRRCILVTNNENNICVEVTQPRVKAVLTGDWADGKHDALPGALQFYRTSFIERKKNLDRMRSDLARHTVDLITIKEGVSPLAKVNDDLNILQGLGSTVAVITSMDPNHEQALEEANKMVRVGDILRAYVFTWSDSGVEDEVKKLWPGWEVEPLPADMLSALRRLQPQKDDDLFADLQEG